MSRFGRACATGALIGLQIFFILIFGLSFAVARFSGRGIWLWLMGVAALGIVACAGLAYWGPVLRLWWLD